MSDERPEPPATPPDPPHDEHAHHGVVETLREELHEVVEHVPQPVRWTVGKLVRVALLGLLALVVLAIVSAVLYLANRTELVAHEATLVINQTLARRSDVVLEIRDLKGNPFTGFVAVQPRVRFRDGGGTLLEADAMHVTYSAFSLLRGGTLPVSVTIERPVIRLDNGPGGTLRVPTWDNGPKRAPAGKPREMRFELHLRDAFVSTPKPIGAISGIELDATGGIGAVTRVSLDRLRWAKGPWHSRLEQFAAELSSDADSVRFRIRELRTGDVALTAVGGWRTGGSVRALHADVAKVRWGWLAEVFDNKSFDVPGQGAATVDASGDHRWDGRYRAHAVWDSLEASAHGRFRWDGRELALDSLSGQSLAGNLEGRLRWSKQGWEIGGEATKADPAHWHALRLNGWPAGELNGRFRYAVDTRGKPSSRLEARLRDSQWTGWHVDSALVRVEFPAAAADSFSVLGWRRGGAFTLRATVDRTGWRGPYTLTQFPLDEWPDGRASGLRGTLLKGGGIVESREGDLLVTGDLEGGLTDWSAAHFSHWTLSGIQGRLLPTPDLDASVRARDGFFVGVHLDSADAVLHLGDRNVTFSPLHASAGDTLFTLTGDADWQADHWHLRATSATAASSQFSWTAEPPLEISGDPSGTVFDRVLANDGAAHLEAKGRWASPGGFYDFRMDGRDLDLGRLGMPLDWGLVGRGTASLVVTGRSGDPAFTFEGRASKPGFAQHRCDSLSLSLAGSPHRLRVTDLLYTMGSGDARGAGEVTGTARAWPDSLTGTAVVRWLADADAWKWRLAARALPVDRLEAFAPAAEGWGGTLDGTLDVSGRPSQPRAELKGRADNFGWRDYRAQRVEVTAALHDGQLDVPDMRVTMQDVVSTLSGRLPVLLALGRDPVVPDTPIEGHVQVPRGDLKLLPALVPLIQAARGRFDLDASVSGTARHPKLVGSGHIREGTVRPAGREEVLENVYADLHFDQTHVTLDSLLAHQGRTGRVWSKGAIELNGVDYKHYAFDLKMRDFASSQTGLYAMLFDGDFTVVDGPPVLGQRLPQVLGDVRVKRGVVEFDFANQSEVQKRAATTEPLYWTYRIHMEAPSNLRWRPPDGELEFNADLDLEQTADSLLIYGDMHLIKGHYFFLSNRFNVTTADLTFDNQKGVDPVLEIEATTRLPYTPNALSSTGGATGLGGLPAGGSSDISKGAPEDIYAHISGRSSQPVIELSSASGLDQREIINQLTLGRFTSGQGPLGYADPFQNYLTRQLNNQLSRDLSKVFNDRINQWEFQREQGELLNGAGGVYVSVGGDVNSQFSWSVRQRLPGFNGPSASATTSPFERDVEVDYRISRFIYLTTELTQHRITGSTSPGALGNSDFNVNLKARWEY